MISFAAAAKSLQSCPTLCDPIDGSPPGSPIPGILQARTLEWVAISFSDAWKWKVKVKSLSHVRLFATAWTAAYQAPPSMGFSRQEHWSGKFHSFSLETHGLGRNKGARGYGNDCLAGSFDISCGNNVRIWARGRQYFSFWRKQEAKTIHRLGKKYSSLKQPFSLNGVAFPDIMSTRTWCRIRKEVRYYSNLT